MSLTIIKLAVIAIVAVVYGGLFWVIYRKYKDCKANPGKYNEIPNFEEYRYSIWYYNPKKSYGIGTSVRHNVPPITFLCLGYFYYYAVTSGIYYYLGMSSHNFCYVSLLTIWFMLLMFLAMPASFFCG